MSGADPPRGARTTPGIRPDFITIKIDRHNQIFSFSIIFEPTV